MHRQFDVTIHVYDDHFDLPGRFVAAHMQEEGSNKDFACSSSDIFPNTDPVQFCFDELERKLRELLGDNPELLKGGEGDS